MPATTKGESRLQLPLDVLRHLGESLWCSTSNSFEDRASAGLEYLRSLGGAPGSALLIEYPPTVELSKNDSGRRRENSRLVDDILGTAAIQRARINPYSFKAFGDAINRATVSTSYRYIIIDVTCITKIHAIAAASWLSEKPHLLSRVFLAYTRPENYGRGSERAGASGWSDIIISPFSSSAILRNERFGRGVIVLGHEAERLVVALAEIEPSGGVIIVPRTENRPDLRQTCELLNRRAIRRLSGGAVGAWTKATVDVSDISALVQITDEQVVATATHGAPTILFPFGPKPQLFAAAYKMAAAAPRTSWFVYPVPLENDISHTEGVDSTIWFSMGGVS